MYRSREGNLACLGTDAVFGASVDTTLGGVRVEGEELREVKVLKDFRVRSVDLDCSKGKKIII